MEGRQRPTGRPITLHRGGLIFLLIVVSIYGIGYLVDPDRISLAASISAANIRSVIVPLCLVFAVLFLSNRYLRAQTVTRLVGAESGLKGGLLALGAGIISMGPAYAWYPLLGEVRRQGAGAGQVAVFLYGRAIKPFLLPVMAAYFGIAFTVLLNLLIAAGALLTGWIAGHLFSDGPPSPAGSMPHGRVSGH